MGHCLGVLSVYLSDNLAVKYKQKPMDIQKLVSQHTRGRHTFQVIF